MEVIPDENTDDSSKKEPSDASDISSGTIEESSFETLLELNKENIPEESNIPLEYYHELLKAERRENSLKLKEAKRDYKVRKEKLLAEVRQLRERSVKNEEIKDIEVTAMRNQVEALKNQIKIRDDENEELKAQIEEMITEEQMKEYMQQAKKEMEQQVKEELDKLQETHQNELIALEKKSQESMRQLNGVHLAEIEDMRRDYSSVANKSRHETHVVTDLVTQLEEELEKQREIAEDADEERQLAVEKMSKELNLAYEKIKQLEQTVRDMEIQHARAMSPSKSRYMSPTRQHPTSPTKSLGAPGSSGSSERSLRSAIAELRARINRQEIAITQSKISNEKLVQEKEKLKAVYEKKQETMRKKIKGLEGQVDHTRGGKSEELTQPARTRGVYTSPVVQRSLGTAQARAAAAQDRRRVNPLNPAAGLLDSPLVFSSSNLRGGEPPGSIKIPRFSSFLKRKNSDEDTESMEKSLEAEANAEETSEENDESAEYRDSLGASPLDAAREKRVGAASVNSRTAMLATHMTSFEPHLIEDESSLTDAGAVGGGVTQRPKKRQRVQLRRQPSVGVQLSTASRATSEIEVDEDGLHMTSVDYGSGVTAAGTAGAGTASGTTSAGGSALGASLGTIGSAAASVVGRLRTGGGLYALGLAKAASANIFQSSKKPGTGSSLSSTKPHQAKQAPEPSKPVVATSAGTTLRETRKEPVHGTSTASKPAVTSSRVTARLGGTSIAGARPGPTQRIAFGSPIKTRIASSKR